MADLRVTAALALLWVAIWYLGAWLTSHRMDAWQPSSTPHENSKYWGAVNFMSAVNALLCSAVCLPCVMVLLMMPERKWFHCPETLDFCFDSTNAYTGALIDYTVALVALVGQSFTIRLVVDLVLQHVHGFLTIEECVHHAVFFISGFLLRMNCVMPLNAAILMSMEASTPALDYYLFFRFRYAFSTDVIIAKAIFALLFVAFRLGLSTFGAYIFMRRHLGPEPAMPDRVPQWEQHTICFVIIAGAGMQWYWGFKLFGGEFRRRCCKRAR